MSWREFAIVFCYAIAAAALCVLIDGLLFRIRVARARRRELVRRQNRIMLEYAAKRIWPSAKVVRQLRAPLYVGPMPGDAYEMGVDAVDRIT